MKPERLSRRDFLKAGAGVAGLGLVALVGCKAAQPTPEPTAAPQEEEPTEAPPAVEEKTITFWGWSFRPDTVREFCDIFEEENPEITIDYQDFPWVDYSDKILTALAAGSGPDAMYMHENFVSSWVPAGWVTPLDDFEGVAELKEEFYPFVVESASVDGKLYGLGYYNGCRVWAYNTDYYEQAGIEAPPRTLAEHKEQCLAAQEAGLVEYGTIFSLKDQGAFWEWYAHLHGSGGHYIDEATMEPLIPDKDPTFLKVLEWLVDATQTSKFNDPAGIEMTTGETRDVFEAGKALQLSIQQYETKHIHDPEVSLVADKSETDMMPALEDTGEYGTLAYSNGYAVNSDSENPDEAFRLIYFLGGKNKAGEIYCAKRWFLEAGLGFGFPVLWDDPDINDEVSKWADIDMMKQQKAAAYVREGVHASWFAEWDSFMHRELQTAVLGQKEPADAVQAIADKWMELKEAAA